MLFKSPSAMICFVFIWCWACDTGATLDPRLTSVRDAGSGAADSDANQGGSADGSAGSDGALDVPLGCGDGEADPEAGLEACDDGNNVEGDGCDSACQVEAGYLCPPTGGSCVANCGDGILRGIEACDDGNNLDGDGCAINCQQELGWVCPSPGEACLAARCGDSLLVGEESCDDGNAVPGDGCSDRCLVEAGWLCAGTSCSAAACGDGVRAGAEHCDDGNEVSGDGCLADCSAREPFYFCPTLGGACSKLTVCGDGVFTPDEACDDGNDLSGDGCSPACTVEAGFLCTSGSSCESVCGDGLVVGAEQCDDGDGGQCVGGSAEGQACVADSACEGGSCEPDGCSAQCRLDSGYKCDAPGEVCEPAVCGNGVREGLEQCDDGMLDSAGVVVPNNALGDGCTPFCSREPSCANGECVATCGDGIVDGAEGCDDQNNLAFDGCSADCEVEQGFDCETIDREPPECVELPLVLRDFKAHDLPQGHPDMDFASGDVGTSLVRDRLGFDLDDDGQDDGAWPSNGAPGPIYAGGTGTATTHGAAAFNQWYRDSLLSKTVLSTMTVCVDRSGGPSDVYVFDDYTFYPIDNQGWQDPGRLNAGLNEEIEDPDVDGSLDGCRSANPDLSDPDMGAEHNFLFTSEVRFWFTYKGTEQLSFVGDDDVFVFVNGFKVLDLGGVHCAQTGLVDLVDFATADKANLTVGKTYEAVVYQAERMPVMSTYHLELGNFLAQTSQCEAICGDGIRTAVEACDDGSACVGGTADGERCQQTADCTGGGACVSLNDGSYGRCQADCQARAHYCGDGVVDAQEQCDLGSEQNDGSYEGCNPDCTAGPRCGDGNADSFFGEQCDEGSANAEGYGLCAPDCSFGPRCGDGVVQSEQDERCDDGRNVSVYAGCAPGCVLAPRCGDGVVQGMQGETCDLGEAKNTGGYGGCTAECLRSAFCGNGKIDGPAGAEACDDGNTNDFDGCSADCAIESKLE